MVLRDTLHSSGCITVEPVDVPVQEVVRDYELSEQLGSGGMGTVYRAVHTRLKRTVAMKILPGRRLRNQSAVNRFEREMEAIGRLNHPAIVRATDAGEVDGTHFLAMDFVDGIDLAQLVKLHGPVAAADACEIIRQAALGLQYYTIRFIDAGNGVKNVMKLTKAEVNLIRKKQNEYG